MRHACILALTLVFSAGLAAPVLADGAAQVATVGVAQRFTPPEVWRTCDPDAGPIDEQVLKRWTTKTAAYKEVYFSAYIEGQTVRVYGIYAAPLQPNQPGSGERAEEPGATVPAVMHLHGGGQTVDGQWLDAWTARGYAVLTCNYHGIWENRDHFTIYPEALKQGNHKYRLGKRQTRRPRPSKMSEPED